MTGMEEGDDGTERAVQHLEAALDAEEMNDVNFHLRHALQLLGLHK